MFYPQSTFLCLVQVYEEVIISVNRIYGFYSRYGTCLLRGTNWVFEYNFG